MEEKNVRYDYANSPILDFCVIDTETTGLDTDKDKIVELSALKVRNGKVVGEFSQLINPMEHISEGATAVNGITDDMVADMPTIDKVIPAFLEFIGNDILVGYNNVWYDNKIIASRFKNAIGEDGNPVNKYMKNYSVDVFRIVKRYAYELQLASKKLTAVSEKFNIDTKGAHRALKDCYMTLGVMLELYAIYGEDIFASEMSGEIKIKLMVDRIANAFNIT